MRYRFNLRRDTSPMLGEGTLGWVMLNPSTADDMADDPTIRKVVGFTRRAGYSRAEVVNLYPMRATDPRALHGATVSQREGPGPTLEGFGVLAECHAVVLAWGFHGDRYPERVEVVRTHIALLGVPVLCLGHTKGGQPRHPLMVSYMQPFVEVTRG